MKKILLLITTFVACINPPEKPDPQIDVALAQKAFKDLSEEVDISDVEKDLSGVAAQATGTIADIKTISEPDVMEMAEYRTGEPGWVEVEETEFILILYLLIRQSRN